MAYVKKTREEKEKEVKSLIENTEKKINTYFESPENIKTYLSFMSKFYNYSLNNSVLIDNQFSGAIGVGSYAFFKQKSFQVNKGEKGIKILVPQIGKDKFKNEKGEIKSLDKATMEEKIKIKDKIYKVVKGKTYFAQGYVFDVSQTTAKAKDLPNLFPNRWLDGSIKDYGDLYKGMKKIAKNIGVKIVEPKQELGVAKGVSYTNSKEIALNPRNTELQNVKTLIHELTHAKLHTMGKSDKYETYEKEFQAELTAYTVCSHFGIDTSEYSLKYIHDWTKDRTLKDKKELLREVRETSIEYIETLEDTLIKGKKIEQQPNEKTLPETAKINEIDNTIKNSESVVAMGTLKEEFKKYMLKKEPSIKIVFSEIDGKKYFSEGENISFQKANERFKEAEKEVRQKKETAKENNEYYPYLKTKIILTIDKDIKKTMRYDIGDGFSNDLKEFCGKRLDKESLELLNTNCVKSQDKEIYKTTEVSKIDNTKEKFHIYQFNDEPEKCFLGQKVNNTIKTLGAISTMGLVKTQFKEFKEFEKNNINTLTKGKTEIQEKVTMLVQELKL